jgi:hypothetical protein
MAVLSTILKLEDEGRYHLMGYPENKLYADEQIIPSRADYDSPLDLIEMNRGLEKL